MENNRLDLTTGKPLQRILQFSTPLIFGTLFQQLYSFVDSIIVGHFISANALGSVGATYSLNFLIIGFMQSFCVGLGIPISQSLGAKYSRDVQRFFWNGLYLSIAISIFFCVLMTYYTEPLLIAMQTPQPLLHDAVIFIRPQFVFIWVTVLYNFSASVLRSLGDSRTPFYTLVFASLLNIIIDVILIGVFRWGVIGAAVATIIAQAVSGLMNIIWLVKTSIIIDFRHPQLKFSARHTYQLAYIAFPMGIEYSISAIGAIIMQFAINSLGTVYVVSQTAGEKIRQMFTLPIESIGMGMATFIGQNYGAHSMSRIRQGIKDGMKIQIIYYGICLIIIMLFADPLSELVIGHHPELIHLSSLYLRLMSLTLFLHGTLMIYRYTLQGLGFSLLAIWSGVGELIGRSIVSLVAIVLNSFIAVCFINPVAWGLAGGYCCWMVYRQLKKITVSFTREVN
ncbi:Na+-driven multidrug efflux pump [Limosilactobacillus coleohominis DSM 14060]|nr:Na+-driven multidrug efflux pump [Limosilactobacillus coleohominis DSM 14060]